jgi:hypothetical protein
LWSYANAISTVCVSDDEVCLLAQIYTLLLIYSSAVVRENPACARANGN